MKKLLTCAALLAASAALSSAASVVSYDLSTLTGVPSSAGTTYSIGEIGTLLDETVSLTWNCTGSAKIWKNSDDSTTVENSYAVAALNELGVTAISVGDIVTTSGYGAGSATQTLVVSGLTAGDTYTIAVVVGCNTGTATYSISGGTLVSYTYYELSSDSDEGTSSSDSSSDDEVVLSLEVSPSDAYLVVADITADDDGTISIAGVGSTKAAFGLFAIVPEPSAFALLAGVGALAFAASRRRRSRKA